MRNQKVDGVILLRTYRKDQAVELLQKKRIPFVAVGDTDYPGVYQVNHDQRAACRELTEKLLSGHGPSIVLLGGRDSLVITWNRLEGFQDAYRACGLDLPESQIYLNLESREAVEQAADEALEAKVPCAPVHGRCDLQLAAEKAAARTSADPAGCAGGVLL